MQLILEAEATIGIQNKMSGINEEILEGNLEVALSKSIDIDISNGSDVLKNISLIDDNKKKELAENQNIFNTNENLSQTDALNITSNSNKEENEKPSEVYNKESIDNQRTMTAQKNEKVAVDDELKSDQKQTCLDLPKVNNVDLNNETVVLPMELDDSFESFKNDTNRNITNSPALENILAENINENQEINNLENEVEDKIDEEAILEDVTQKDKKCILENVLKNNMDEDDILKDTAENKEICILENELDTKTEADAVLENVAENGNIRNLEVETGSEMDKHTVLGEVIQKKTIINLEIKVNKKIDEESVSAPVGESDNTSNKENNLENIINENSVLENVFENDKIKNLENEFENKLDKTNILEKKEEHKNEHGYIIENKTGGDENLSCVNDKDLNRNGEHDKYVPDNEDSLAKHGNNISNSSTDQNDERNFNLHHAEMPEESKCTRNKQEERDPIEMKIPSTDEQTADKQEDGKKEKHVGKNEKENKEIKKSLLSKLRNTLDILSDDEDELPDIAKVIDNINNYNQGLSLVDDDDVMLIEENTDERKENKSQINENISEVSVKTNLEKPNPQLMDINEEDLKQETVPEAISMENEFDLMLINTKCDAVKPLLPLNFLKNYKKNLADMTREELEEFCISKIVESVVNRSNLGDIKAQLKITAHAVEEYKKKLMMISKQTRDLQVILKSVQEEQKKPSAYSVTPLKLTRSVGMQVFMTDKPISKKRQQSLILNNSSSIDKSNRNNATSMKTPKNNQQIPVPRLVPAASPANKATSIAQPIANIAATKSPQTNNSLVNGLKNSPPTQKPEKRTRLQTVDLTDDEPPSKIAPKSSPTPPVRLVPPQNLLAPQRQPFPPNNNNSPRKVFIPISSPQAPNIRPGQTFLLKSVTSTPGSKPKAPTSSVPKVQSNSVKTTKPKHPPPLPDVMKQYQPPNWKALPPAPEVKLTKVDNGIVISWKIEDYEPDSYEEIISYQIYAYQETSSPPSTPLWKKIGDVKALPLPMACTLTQFLAGFKYYFAVRAIDVKSRLGPFSVPGNILLLNKM